MGTAPECMRLPLGVCFEAQHFPDYINIPAFKQAVLRPGDTYSHVTEYKFGVSDNV